MSPWKDVALSENAVPPIPKADQSPFHAATLGAAAKIMRIQLPPVFGGGGEDSPS